MFNLLLVILNYLLPTITTHYLDAKSFLCHNRMPFGISFTLEATRLGNGNFTAPFFILITTTLHKPGVIGALWNVIPTTPHINPIA